MGNSFVITNLVMSVAIFSRKQTHEIRRVNVKRGKFIVTLSYHSLVLYLWSKAFYASHAPPPTFPTIADEPWKTKKVQSGKSQLHLQIAFDQ